MRHAHSTPQGSLGLVVKKASSLVRPKLEVFTRGKSIPDEVKRWNPQTQAGLYFKSICQYLPKQAALDMVGLLQEIVTLESRLSLVVYRFHPDPSATRIVEDYGLVSARVVTNNGVAWLVDCFEGATTATITQMKYHGIGLTPAAEAVADSALGNEITPTNLAAPSTRAVGTTVQGSAANIYETVGTLTSAFAPAQGLPIVEHGVFNTATIAAASTTNLLWDRSVFLTITLNNGDSIQATYDLTFTAGGL